jgi:WD40 repeat protein
VAKTPELSLLLARQAVALNDSEETESTLLAALLRWQGALRIVRPNGQRLLRVVLSPNDDWVAFSDNAESLFVYDARTLQRIRVIDGIIDEMVASRDGRALFVAIAAQKQGGREQIKAFDVRTGAVLWTAHSGNGQSGFALSPDGSTLAIASDPQIDTPFGPRPSGKPAGLTLLDAADGTAARPTIPLGDYRGVAFAGSHLVATQDGARIGLLDLRSGRVVRTFVGATAGFAVSSDGSTLALGQTNGSVRLVEVKTGRRRLLTAPSTFVIDHLVFSPDGRTLGAAGGNGVVVTWDVSSGNATSLHGQTGNVTGIDFSADGRTMWTDGLDGTAVEWDLAGDRSLRHVIGGNPVGTTDSSCLPWSAYSPDGSLLAITGCDHRTRLFDSTSLDLVRTLPKDSFECCMPPAIDRKMERMATVDGTGVDLWNPGDGTLIRRLYTSPTKPDPNAAPPVDAQAITPDGKTVAANDGAAVLLIDADTGKIERRLDARSYVVVVTFDPSGHLLEASTEDGGVVVWDAGSGRRLWRRVVPSQSAVGGFSSDGRLFATGTGDGQVVVFEARSGRPVGKPFVGDAGLVFSVTFNPRSGIIASTGTDGVVTLTDVRTGRQFGSPLTGSSEAFSVGAWSPSGARYAVAGSDGKAYVWDMAVRDWADRACRTAGRSLTRDEWRQFLPDRPYQPAC